MSESRVEFYRDEAGEWRWKVVAANGEIVGDSSEGYKSKADAEHGFDLTAEAGQQVNE